MRILCVCVLAIGLGAASAHATVLVPADLGELSHDAIAIARGRVAAVDGQWTEDHRTIETIVSLQVDEYLKGSLGAVVRFRGAEPECCWAWIAAARRRPRSVAPVVRQRPRTTAASASRS